MGSSGVKNANRPRRLNVDGGLDDSDAPYGPRTTPRPGILHPAWGSLRRVSSQGGMPALRSQRKRVDCVHVER